MNCLAYALEFWDNHPEYQIFYDGDHAVNLEVKLALPEMELLPKMIGMRPITEWKYDFIAKSFNGLLTKPQEKLLRKYYNL